MVDYSDDQSRNASHPECDYRGKPPENPSSTLRHPVVILHFGSRMALGSGGEDRGQPLRLELPSVSTDTALQGTEPIQDRRTPTGVVACVADSGSAARCFSVPKLA